MIRQIVETVLGFALVGLALRRVVLTECRRQQSNSI